MRKRSNIPATTGLQLIENRITLVTKRDLAARLSLSVSMVNKMMDQGLPYVKFGRAVRFDLVKVTAWLNERSYP